MVQHPGARFELHSARPEHCRSRTCRFEEHTCLLPPNAFGSSVHGSLKAISALAANDVDRFALGKICYEGDLSAYLIQVWHNV